MSIQNHPFFCIGNCGKVLHYIINGDRTILAEYGNNQEHKCPNLTRGDYFTIQPCGTKEACTLCSISFKARVRVLYQKHNDEGQVTGINHVTTKLIICISCVLRILHAVNPHAKGTPAT